MTQLQSMKTNPKTKHGKKFISKKSRRGKIKSNKARSGKI